MPDHVSFDIAYIHPYDFVPLRGRAVQNAFLPGSVRVTVPCVGGGDAPLAIKLTGSTPAERRFFEGRLVAPHQRPDQIGDFSRANGMAVGLARADYSHNYLFPELRSDERPWTSANPRGFREVTPGAVARVVHDGRGAVEERVRRVVESWVMVDGVLHAARPAPLAALTLYTGGKGRIGVDDRLHEPHSYRLCLDRFRDLHDFFVDYAVENNFNILDLDCVVDQLDPAAIGDFPEDVANARLAIDSVLFDAGQYLAQLPAAALRDLVRLRELKDEFGAGTARAPEVAETTALFRSLEDHRITSSAQAVLLKRSLGLASGVMALSRPALQAEPLAEADLSAFAGL